MIEVDKYIASLQDKGMDRDAIISKLSKHTGIEEYFLKIMWEVCEDNDSEEWYNQLRAKDF